MADQRARIGVIGTGWWCTMHHLPNLTAHPDAEIIGVADANLDKARKAADKFGIPRAFGDHRELLALKPDGVLIATPHYTHYELARDALLAGADVMVEKPMVVEPAHGRELVALARRTGRNLHVGYPYPYTRHCQTLHNLIRAGDLGEILFATCLFATQVHDLYKGKTDVATPGAMWGPAEGTYSDPGKGGGQALTQVTHSASLLFFLTGLRPVAVHAFTGNYDTTVDVWDSFHFRTASGAVGSVTSTGTVSAKQDTVEEFRIFGSKGHALLDIRNRTLVICYNDGRIQTEEPLALAEQYPTHATSHRLVDCILGRAPVMVSGELGLLTAEFVGAALESARRGVTVSIPG